MRGLPGGKAHVAEDDVLDSFLEKGLAARDELVRLLLEEVEDHREVVGAQAPERVLVRADRPQVLAVAVHVEHLAEGARVDDLLQLEDAGVVEEQVPGHEGEPQLLGQRDESLRVLGADGHGLLDEDVLAGGEGAPRELRVRRHRRRDDYRLDSVVPEDVVEVAWSCAADG